MCTAFLWFELANFSFRSCVGPMSFEGAWRERKALRRVRRSHLDRLSVNPPIPVDWVARGEAPNAPPVQIEFPRSRMVRSRNPKSGKRRPRPHNIDQEGVEVAEEEDEDEEKLRPWHQRRTSPRHPSFTAELVPSSSAPQGDTFHGLSPSLGRAERVTEDGNRVDSVIETPAPSLVVGTPSGPSWLRPNFVIPDDEVGSSLQRDRSSNSSSLQPPLHQQIPLNSSRVSCLELSY